MSLEMLLLIWCFQTVEVFLDACKREDVVCGFFGVLFDDDDGTEDGCDFFFLDAARRGEARAVLADGRPEVYLYLPWERLDICAFPLVSIVLDVWGYLRDRRAHRSRHHHNSLIAPTSTLPSSQGLSPDLAAPSRFR
jgi:hypothetical protein